MKLGELISPEYFHGLVFEIPTPLFVPPLSPDSIVATDSFFQKNGFSRKRLFANVEIKVVNPFDQNKKETWQYAVLRRYPEEIISYSTEPPSEFFENFYSNKEWFKEYNLRDGALIYLKIPYAMET